tara:strand:- start:10 stop:420 length:411 start_codon:yes stop_codon:yes gene_type:complete
MMVALVPFATMSQKRAPKGKTQKTENTSKIKTNFMIIKGVEIPINMSGKVEKVTTEEESEEISMKRHLKPMTKLMVTFDFGSAGSKESQSLMSESKSIRTMADAVNKAAEYGWEFVNSTVVVDRKVTIHYYYMKRR